MTSRRPMTRSFSGNGRTSSFSEEEGSSSNGRSETRNTYLSNVRPENRSTLCSVMAQLTEDIQPSFETTLKSKAVSENCNVKFSCVVSGYPAPELKWYKDDMEMDRYCGLPKYEIRRNGKTHTLHIYNCTLDDAAIYQVSASNSKGIVSCSGVLEVGTMNEYQIHQRFFAKLKQKAEKKRNEMDAQNKKEEKVVIQTEKLQSSPEPPPRKRPIQQSEERPAVKRPEAVEGQGVAAESNGVSTEVKGTAAVTNKDLVETSPSENSLATKKLKISNGIDVPVSSASSNSSITRSPVMGNGGENCYDGGISLAQFLAETLQSQATEEKQSSPRGERHKEIDVSTVSAGKENDREQGRMQREKEEQEKVPAEEREREKKTEEELEKERQLEKLHTMLHTKHGSDVKHQSKAHKDHDHHKIQASISSMFHSVKDFLFGKSKKDSHEHTVSQEREFDHGPLQPETPPSFRLRSENNQVCDAVTEDTLPMEIDQPKEPLETVSLGLHEHKQDDNAPHTELTPPEIAEESTGLHVEGADYAEEVMEVSVGPEISSPAAEMSLFGLQVLTEASPTLQQQPESPEVSPLPNHQAVVDDSSLPGDVPVMPNLQPSIEEESSPTLSSLEESLTPPPSVILSSDRHSPAEAPSETTQEEELGVDGMDKESEPSTEESCSFNQLHEEEKVEAKLNQPPCLDVNRSEITELTTSSLEERIEPREPKTPDQLLSTPYAVTAYSQEREDVKDESEHASPQEMNVGYPPSLPPESLKKGDLEIQQEYTSPAQEESTEILNVSVIQSSDLGFCGNVESPVLERAELSNNLQTQDREILEAENTEARSESLPFEVGTEMKSEIEVEELEEAGNLSVTRNEEVDVNVVEEHQDDNERQQIENIPQIQISTVEDTPEIKPTEIFMIPQVEVMEPELKECTLPLTILALTKLESEPATLQSHDTTCVADETVQNKKVTDYQSLLPTQIGMQSDYNLSPTKKIEEVAQLYDKTEMFEREQLPMTSGEQIALTSIPVINVLCTDDKDDGVYVNSHVSDPQQPSETATVPLFVVPPISVTCYESDPVLRQPTQSEHTLTETPNVMQRGIESDVGNNSTTTDHEKITDNSIEEKIPSLIDEALMPKVGDSGSLSSKTADDNIVLKSLKETKTENYVSLEDLQRNRSSGERLCSKPPTYPSLSPSSLRKFMSKAASDTDSVTVTTSDRQSDKADEDLSGGSTPTSSLSCESSPRLKRRDSLSLIRSATPEELASGARRKIFIPKPKEDGEGAIVGVLDTQGKKESPYMSPSQARRAALLQAPTGQSTPPMERRSPLLSRRKITLEVPKVVEETPKEEQTSTKREEKPEKKLDPLKAPQVIRKIRGEPFPDASGHLKLWCQFFNVLSDSTIKWFRDEEEILELKRSGGDESQVALAIVLASNGDCGVYGCSIKNEYGSDMTDFLLSEDILSEILLKDDLEVGEEIEMTPMLFTRGLADSGNWGDKYFGRIMTEAANIGEGCAHKASKVKVIYGLDPIFESGSACVIKVQNPIAYGTKQESNLAERNLEITKQECKVQNMIREYCKIFAAETRVTENFGSSFEVIPQYLMYRPANSVPYATVEADLTGDFQNYCTIDSKGKLITQTSSEVEQKCSTFQHWIHQWTHGNLLVTRLEGVETKMTNVRVVTKSKGYQGLTENGSPEVFEQFPTSHQCNYYCGLLGLHPLKTKGSRSPLLNRKLGSSPQLQRKGHSPQMLRKANSSPKVSKKVQETEDNKPGLKQKPVETPDALEMR
ncbi:titin homolog [Xyrichtys novacula]|uniref:non-specific serine/threonine protein kinase n=1 Tax=Xyrichtys novacula TaxID=13765 RepID=A0AAV1F631_XYRNO|nr:titin homolog [Xyrichtys novacula]